MTRGTTLSFLPAMLHSQLFCTKMELLAINKQTNIK